MLINYFLQSKKINKLEASRLINQRAELPIFCETKRITTALGTLDYSLYFTPPSLVKNVPFESVLISRSQNFSCNCFLPDLNLNVSKVFGTKRTFIGFLSI